MFCCVFKLALAASSISQKETRHNLFNTMSLLYNILLTWTKSKICMINTMCET